VKKALVVLFVIVAMIFSVIPADAQLIKLPAALQSPFGLGLHECDPIGTDCQDRNCHTIDGGTLLHCDPIIVDIFDFPPFDPTCPNDSDCDGIPDDVDKCPFDKEIYNDFMDEDGCPDVRPFPQPEEVSELTPIVVATMIAGLAISTVIISSLIILRTKK